MALDTSTQVEQIRQVQADDGQKVAPASDDHGIDEESTGVDVYQNTQTLTPAVPGRGATLNAFVKFANGAGHVEVVFKDSNGNEIGRRTPTENGDYSVSGAGQVYIQAAVPCEQVTVEVHDDSAASNTSTWGVKVT